MRAGNLPSKTGRYAIVVVAALLLAATLPVTMPRAADTAGEGDGTSTTFTWQAPKNFTGTFAATVIVDPQGEARCTRSVSATGTFNASNPVAFWQTGHLEYAGHWRHPVQVHAGPADTRPLTATKGGSWNKPGGLGERTIEEGETIQFTVAALDLKHRDDSGLDSPLTIEVSCDAPIDVERQAGRHVRTFTPETLEGGIGASTNLPPTRIVAHDDRLVETFETPIVRFQAFQMVSPPSDREGTMRLDHPGGSESWTWDPAGPDRIDLEGAPGRYEVTLDWYGDWSDPLVGAIMGLEPVDSLDEVFE